MKLGGSRGDEQREEVIGARLAGDTGLRYPIRQLHWADQRKRVVRGRSVIGAEGDNSFWPDAAAAHQDRNCYDRRGSHRDGACACAVPSRLCHTGRTVVPCPTWRNCPQPAFYDFLFTKFHGPLAAFRSPTIPGVRALPVHRRVKRRPQGQEALRSRATEPSPENVFINRPRRF